MQRALNQHAEAVYEQLASDAHRRMAEKVFRGLTTFQQGRAVRRPATVQHLYDITGASSDVDRDLVRSVVRAFAARKCSFLLSSHGESLRPESVIDISHESLIRKWRRLRGWVSEEARSAEFYRDVSRDTALHEKGDAGLWRGKKLAGALKYVNSGEWNEAWAGQYERGDGSRFQPSVAFLHASRKRERFLFGSIVGLVLLLMFALAWGGVSSVRQRQVEERVREVEERAASLLAQAEEAQGRAVDASKTAEELRQIADRLQSAGGERVGEIQRLNEQIDRLQAESEKYKEVAGTAREQAEDVQQKGAPVRQETDPVSARRIAELDEQLQRAQSESSGLRDQLAAARAKVADLESAPKMKDTAALAIGDARALEASTAVGPLDKLSAWQKVLALSTAAADARKEAEERISFWQGHVDSWFLDRVQAGDIDSARQGLAAGAAPNAKDANSVTALMWAAENGHLDVVRALVQAGADVNSRDRSNFTALRRAERRGRGEIVRYLKSVGAR
jgi:hypothetical protein